MVNGVFLLYRGQEHLVYRGNILRKKPLKGVGKIPLLLLPAADLWNFNIQHDQVQIEYARRYAESVGMKDPINVVEGGGRSSDGKTEFGPKDYFRVRDVPDDASLSPLVDRMLFYDGTGKQSLGYVLKSYPGLKFAEPIKFETSSDLRRKGLKLDQNVSDIKRLTDIIIGLEKSGKRVFVGGDAHNVDGTPYRGAVSVYTN